LRASAGVVLQTVIAMLATIAHAAIARVLGTFSRLYMTPLSNAAALVLTYRNIQEPICTESDIRPVRQDGRRGQVLRIVPVRLPSDRPPSAQCATAFIPIDPFVWTALSV
jgi:hypothetical protein